MSNPPAPIVGEHKGWLLPYTLTRPRGLITPARKKSYSSSFDTPMSESSHGPQAGYATVIDEQAAILAELNGHIYEDDQFGQKAFEGKVASDEEIRAFITQGGLYDTKEERWKDIPEDSTPEKDLYSPLVKVIGAVLGHFKYTENRSIHDSHAEWHSHEITGDGKELKSAPDLSVKGTGNNFPPLVSMLPNIKAKRPNYRDYVSPLEVKTKKNRNFLSNLAQIAVYARQCFIQQKNRYFVYSLIITETDVQLYVFDRSGVYHSTRIDIHQFPVNFVRLLLGVCSKDDKLVGFDPSIRWEGQKRFLDSIDSKGEKTRYEMLQPNCSFFRRAIRGRGTCCWKVKDAKGKRLLIKDSWRARGRLPEAEFLEKAKGLLGVAQMIAFEDGPHISAMRGIVLDDISDDKKFLDRTFCRMILQDHGKPIEEFSNREEVLFAFRDAIIGHQNLWNANILHRDVSSNNIIIGNSGCEDGYRGVLIDLDMAIWLSRTESLAGADFRTGTRAFQSIKVLESFNAGANCRSHDYLDDLESFFYVLCWICYGYYFPNTKVSPFPKLLEDWECTDPSQAAKFKALLMLDDLDMVTDYFGPIFHTLLQSLQAFFRPHVSKRKKPQPRKMLLELVPTAKDDYKTVLGFVNDAIKELEAFNVAAAKESDEEDSSPPLRLLRTPGILFPRSPLFDIPLNTPPSPSPSGRKRSLKWMQSMKRAHI